MLPRTVFLIVFKVLHVHPDLLKECSKLYNPLNYMNQLPHLNMPYIDRISVPNNHHVKLNSKIRPTPAVTTKAFDVVTKYVYRNPVCVKNSKNKNFCKSDSTAKTKNNLERIVTKEYFVRNRENLEDFLEEGFFIESSEEPRSFPKRLDRTPVLTPQIVHEMLIEDRLDQLETILPHYSRRRTYETVTMTVTKVLSNKRVMATLMVHNCVPQGYALCSNINKKRKSKVAMYSNSSNEGHYFG